MVHAINFCSRWQLPAVALAVLLKLTACSLVQGNGDSKTLYERMRGAVVGNTAPAPAVRPVRCVKGDGSTVPTEGAFLKNICAAQAPSVFIVHGCWVIA